VTDQHANLSPSGAHRWMTCAGSPVLGALVPDTGSVYADEGTSAHMLASWCLDGTLDAADFVGEAIRIGERSFAVTDEFAGHVQTYVDLVRGLAKDAELLVERRVPIGHITGEPGAGGTSDAIIVDSGKGVLTVVDLKFGRGVEVSATSNEQMMLYALGALEEYSVLGDFETVVMVISQPRVTSTPSMWAIPAADLLRFAEVVAAAADTSRAAEKAYADPGVDQGAWAEAYLNPGEKQCRFCNAKASCPALRASVAEIAGGSSAPASVEDFAAFVPMTVDAGTGPNYLSVAMAKVGLVEDWCKAVRAEVERVLVSGGSVDGFKLVEGRRGNRAWSNEAEAEALLKSFRLKKDEMYNLKLISPTQAEKVLKDKPRQWGKAEAILKRADGKPSVAPATDPRPAVSVTATAEDFSNFVNAE